MASGMAGMMDLTNGLGVEGKEACGISHPSRVMLRLLEKL